MRTVDPLWLERPCGTVACADEMPESVGVPTEGKQRAKERDSADVNQRRKSVAFR